MRRLFAMKKITNRNHGKPSRPAWRIEAEEASPATMKIYTATIVQRTCNARATPCNAPFFLLRAKRATPFYRGVARTCVHPPRCTWRCTFSVQNCLGNDGLRGLIQQSRF